MIETPFLVEEYFTDKEFEQLGQLLLRWSHIENLVANSLRVLLRLSEEEARIVVFPLTLDYRINKIDDLSKLNSMPPLAETAFKELKPCIKAIQEIRSSVVHAIAAYDNADGYVFHSKKTNTSKSRKEIFDCVEFVNYAAHVALSFRYALGLKGAEGEQHPLPKRPVIPALIQKWFPTPKIQKAAKRKGPPQSSRAKH